MPKKISNKFTINFNGGGSFAYNALMNNYFVEEVLKKRSTHDLKSQQILFRLIRISLLGDILYKKSEKKINTVKITESEFLAAIFESYIFLIRSLYDYLLHFLKDDYGVREDSFNDFLKKIKSDKYLNIPENLKKYLKNDQNFEDIRLLRDSIKRQTPCIFVYVENKIYKVKGTVYNRNGDKKNFDDILFEKIFGYSAILLILMSYIAESVTGVTLKEQLIKLKNN